MARTKLKPKKPVDTKPKTERPSGQETVAEEVSRLCTEFKEITIEKRSIEEQQKTRQHELDAISGRLVELVEMSDIQPPFNLDGGGRISIKSDLSVKQEDKDKLCHSLEELGLGDLIKPTINTNSLASVVKELLESHKKIPDGITVTPYKKAVFTATADKG